MLIQIAPKTIKKNETVIGIDLGTTHSLIAYKKNNEYRLIKWSGISHLLPSVVSYGKEKTKVGYEALKEPLDSGILSSTKRFMHDPNQFLYAKKTPIDVAKDILSYMKNQTEKTLKTEIRQCVISVPAYFDDTARNATKYAAECAGLEVLRIINEPTAAALSYGIDKGSEGVYAIYDFGGGTFDISILRMTKGIFQVLSTSGNTQLGGDDIDNAIVAHFIKKYGQSNMHQYKNLAKIFKEKLSSYEEISEEGITFSRSELHEISKPLIDETFDLIKKAISDARILLSDLKGIVLVGGSTKLQGLKEQLETEFPTKIYDDINPDEIVAVGAAIQANQLYYGGDNILLDVNSLSLGLETMGGIVEKIIHKNTPIPTVAKQTFTTYKDGQTAIKFHIVQGERELAKDCRSLAEFVLKDLPPHRANTLVVEVIFQLDVDGILTVKASYEGKEVSVQIKPSYGLDYSEVQKMIYDANLNAKHDMQERAFQKMKIEAEKISEVALVCLNDPIAEISCDEKNKILEAVASLQSSSNLEDSIKNLAALLHKPIEKRLQAGLKKRTVGLKA